MQTVFIYLYFSILDLDKAFDITLFNVHGVLTLSLKSLFFRIFHNFKRISMYHLNFSSNVHYLYVGFMYFVTDFPSVVEC